MLSITTLLILYTNLKSLFNYLVRLSTIQKKYLIINIITAIKLIIDKMLSITTLLILYTNLKLLFNYLVRLSII